MSRKHPVGEIELSVENVKAFSNDNYEGLSIQWSSKIGFGEYDFYRKKGETQWHADTEYMDKDDDKDFGRELLKLWMDSVTIEE